MFNSRSSVCWMWTQKVRRGSDFGRGIVCDQWEAVWGKKKISDQTQAHPVVTLRSTVRPLSKVDPPPATWLTRHLRHVTLYPVSRPGDIEHLIKHALQGSNVTILSSALSIPPWPFSVLTFVAYQAWRWRMGGMQRGVVPCRRRAEVGGGSGHAGRIYRK